MFDFWDSFHFPVNLISGTFQVKFLLIASSWSQSNQLMRAIPGFIRQKPPFMQ